MNRPFLVLCVLLSAISCSANKGMRTSMRAAASSQSVTLQPWLVGLTAVVGFLLILFIILIAHRLLRKNREYEEARSYDNKAVKEDEEARCYDNKAVEEDEGDAKQTSL
ncbi:small integral membrane protein 24 [Larimichthys crocea]|uniref:Uncharacterized protein n=1 Tax=Larimichthys crocea TaxID=215358 RepID=A0ACD3RMH7_LARCR|nr:small integral membrane protein 24 [Larimichthys crocea]TMS20654.1 Small integral membrane protein 24 [Larimichthys crocea]